MLTLEGVILIITACLYCCVFCDPLQDRTAAGLWHGWFWGYDDITAKSFQCLSCQAQIVSFTSFVDETSGQSVMFNRAETLTHGSFSEWSPEWWAVCLLNALSFDDIYRSDVLFKSYPTRFD